MTFPLRGAAILSSFLLLCGCVAPMDGREANATATTRLTRYCAGRCGVLTMTKSQKLKNRWLVDFDTPTRKFTVTVEGDGNTKVDVWDK
jgi:hypothetical protein